MVRDAITQTAGCLGAVALHRLRRGQKQSQEWDEVGVIEMKFMNRAMADGGG